MAITDRTKDVIKSGGEWISSIELENTAMGHPAVAEAAVIGIGASQMDRATACCLSSCEAEDRTFRLQDMLSFYAGKVADWCIPNDVVFVDELPHTATGKTQRKLNCDGNSLTIVFLNSFPK